MAKICDAIPKCNNCGTASRMANSITCSFFGIDEKSVTLLSRSHAQLSEGSKGHCGKTIGGNHDWKTAVPISNR